MQEVVEACGVSILRKIKGQEYKFGLLSLHDFVEIQHWAENQARDEMTLLVEALKLDELGRTRMAEGFRLRVGEMLCGFEANEQMLWRSLRQHQPKITVEESGRLCDMRTLSALAEEIEEMSLPAKKKDDESADPRESASTTPGPPQPSES